MEAMLHQQSVAQAFLKNRESKSDARKAHLYQQMPVTPVYSRPGSSCSQPPTLYSNGAHKTAIMLDTDVYDNYFPSTPALSTSGSAIGSPKMCDAMQTPVNPMFSGLDGAFHGKDLFDSVETSVLDWSSCASPPMTPVYIASQPLALQHGTSDLISMTSCPSLSPSPTPAYARSIAASEQDLDFCDPRNLTVSAGSNPTLAPEFSLTNAGDAEVKGANAQSTFDFNPAIPHGLPAFQDLDDLDSEDDFSNLVNIEASGAETTRPRACTGSSVVSLGHCSFDDELTFEDSDSFSFMPFPNADITPSVDDGHCDKKQKKSHKDTVDADELAEADPELTSGDSVSSESTVSSPSDDSTPSVAAPPSRRGRKQSLTEDPSKTFVCDLCNRRFRRQEHLKRHYRSLHTQEKPFECNECGKKFSRSDNLAQHARTHSGGAIVMDLIEDHASHFDGNAMAGSGDDFSYGKVMFQIGSEVSDMSKDVSDNNNNKKRKRSD